MKVIKLSKRFKLYKEGYTHALRFIKWDGAVVYPIEKKMADMLGTQYSWRQPTIWRGTFGSNVDSKTGYKPYYIAVRNESHLTMALLAIQNLGK